MKKFFPLFVVCIMLILPLSVVYADEHETEIPLLVIYQSFNLVGDDPLDGPSQTESDPPSQNDFHAFITGRNLSVFADVPFPAHLSVVNLNTSHLVVNRNFTHSDSALLPSAGTYRIEIRISRMVLYADFEVE